jgi:hypothetical protein
VWDIFTGITSRSDKFQADPLRVVEIADQPGFRPVRATAPAAVHGTRCTHREKAPGRHPAPAASTLSASALTALVRLPSLAVGVICAVTQGDQAECRDAEAAIANSGRGLG